jgi:hypothetical protein
MAFLTMEDSGFSYTAAEQRFYALSLHNGWFFCPALFVEAPRACPEDLEPVPKPVPKQVI